MIELRPSIAPEMALLALAAAGLVLALLFRRLRTVLDRRPSRVLFGLRLLACAVLLLGLLGPAWVRTRLDRERSKVLLLVDDTASMGTPDAGSRTRLDAARKAAFEDLAPAIGRRLPVQVLAFAGSAIRPAATPSDLRAAGEGSDVLAALRSAVAREGEDAIAAVVLVTDGGDRPGVLKDLPAVPVFCAGVGSDLRGFPDRRLSELSAPETAEARTTFELRGRAEASGRAAAAKDASLILREGGRERDRVRLDLSSGAASFEFRVTEDEPGVRRYDLELQTSAGEISTLNNRAWAVVEVRSLQVRVLYFDASVSTEFRPIRRELAADPGVEFVSILAVRAARPIRQGGRPGDGLDEGLPRAAKGLEPFDCILLGPLPASALDGSQQKALRERVERGGGLMLLGGEGAFGRGGWRGTPLSPLFPWEISDREPPLSTGRFEIAWTPEAASHPATRGLEEGGANASRMTVASLNLPGTLRPGAVALGVARLPAGRDVPAIAAQTFGQGRVLGIATNTLARWSSESDASARAFGRFLRQSVRWAAGKDASGGFLRLEPSRRSAPFGEPIAVAAETRDRERRLSSAGALDACLASIEGKDAGRVPFVPSPSEPGRWNASVALPEAGPFRLRATLRDADGEIETREILLVSGGREPEGQSLAMKEPFLRELAAATGGDYADAAGAADLAAGIRARIRGKENRTEQSFVTDLPLVFLAFLLLAAAEWVARRRYNLF
ncbi:MAG: hypothetical protein AAB215_06390 [Planctomycetota bacterium]